MATQQSTKLFEPVRLGSIELGHRVVMAPLTRLRSETPGGHSRGPDA
jgi:N-ethylmaleimide reductase